MLREDQDVLNQATEELWDDPTSVDMSRGSATAPLAEQTKQIIAGDRDAKHFTTTTSPFVSADDAAKLAEWFHITDRHDVAERLAENNGPQTCEYALAELAGVPTDKVYGEHVMWEALVIAGLNIQDRDEIVRRLSRPGAYLDRPDKSLLEVSHLPMEILDKFLAAVQEVPDHEPHPIRAALYAVLGDERHAPLPEDEGDAASA